LGFSGKKMGNSPLNFNLKFSGVGKIRGKKGIGPWEKGPLREGGEGSHNDTFG